jgi:hypothetical protein
LIAKKNLILVFSPAEETAWTMELGQRMKGKGQFMCSSTFSLSYTLIKTGSRMTLYLEEHEQKFLAELLDSQLWKLREEILRTDSLSYKDLLRKKEAVLNEITTKLAEVHEPVAPFSAES